MYSKSDQTIEKYAISFNFEGHPFNFLLKKKPSVELASLAILEMWSPPFQVLTDADSQVRWICYLSECDPFEAIIFHNVTLWAASFTKWRLPFTPIITFPYE